MADTCITDLHPASSHLRGLVPATVGLADVPRPPLVQMGSFVKFAFVYGLLARGTDTADGDIDLMIVGAVSTRKMVGVLAGASGVLGREANLGACPTDEFRQKLCSGSAFLQNVVAAAPKIWPVGSVADYDRAGSTSEGELSELIREVEEFKDDVIAWPARYHQDLERATS